MSKSVLYIEGKSGASGDMLLAALLDLGYPLKELRKTLGQFSIPLDVQEECVIKKGLKARSITPVYPATPQETWGLNDFLKLISESKLPSSIQKKSKSLFEKLAEVEATIHGKTADSIHFHELGGWDTIIDVVGCLSGFEYLNADEIWIGPLNVGDGMIQSQHGLLPVPAPAVLELLHGFTIYSSGVQDELLTPTAALLLSSIGKPTQSIPKMSLEKTGYGAGKKDFATPNVLRILMGQRTAITDASQILKLETNIDDMNPQIWEYLFETLYEAEAHEVFLTPVMMKKSRPAHVLTVLAPIEKENEITEIVFRETTTLGIRKEIVSRITLQREMIQVETPYGSVPCKVGKHKGEQVNFAPEYESIKAIAKNKKVPLKKVYQAALENFEKSN